MIITHLWCHGYSASSDFVIMSARLEARIKPACTKAAMDSDHLAINITRMFVSSTSLFVLTADVNET
jgi:hypothetical protein